MSFTPPRPQGRELLGELEQLNPPEIPTPKYDFSELIEAGTVIVVLRNQRTELRYEILHRCVAAQAVTSCWNQDENNVPVKPKVCDRYFELDREETGTVFFKRISRGS